MKVAAAMAAFEDAARSLQSICSTPYPTQISRAVDLLVKRLSEGNKLLVCGNGGSAADAMHICAELVGRFTRERRALPAIALNTDPAILTAWSNDYSYESVFSRQVEALAKPGDIVWGISTSGNSKNVVAALKTARELEASTLALTGQGGGAMAEYADVLLAVPLSVTARIQEVHTLTYHIICEAVEAALCNPLAQARGSE
ncbi:MAG: D-sedoheptulose 7-phosphate isomerase [Bryobacteraceae bacterium]